MSDQVKCIAVRAMISVIALLFLLLINSQLVESGEYVVGDHNGWDTNVSTWGQVGSFRNGDVLVFKYEQGKHNVANVDLDGFKNCYPRLLSLIYDSGNDHFELRMDGFNFFISTIGEDCHKGLKLAVLVIPRKV